MSDCFFCFWNKEASHLPTAADTCFWNNSNEKRFQKDA